MLSTKAFSYDSTRKELSAEISTLSCNGGGFCRAYPDACDMGIEVVSHKTGEAVMFAVTKIDWADANHEDIGGWWLDPVPESVRKVPACKGMKMLVIND